MGRETRTRSLCRLGGGRPRYCRRWTRTAQGGRRSDHWPRRRREKGQAGLPVRGESPLSQPLHVPPVFPSLERTDESRTERDSPFCAPHRSSSRRRILRPGRRTLTRDQRSTNSGCPRPACSATGRQTHRPKTTTRACRKRGHDGTSSSREGSVRSERPSSATCSCRVGLPVRTASALARPRPKMRRGRRTSS